MTQLQTDIPVIDSTFSQSEIVMAGAPGNVSSEDSVASPPPVYGVIITPPEPYIQQRREEPDKGISFITLSLFLLFCIVAFRFHNNSKFLGSLFRNIVEVKERGNMFDDTVRETSFLVFLNLLWCASAGVMLFRLQEVIGGSPFPGDSCPGFSFSSSACMAICIGVALVYTIFMTAAYLTIGNVFSDSVHARIWLKGFAASQGLLGFLYFPLALAFIAYPENTVPFLWTAAIGFILAKTMFIWKGLRIFFTQISSWVLFLYYLCSLEIVPLILTYFTAFFLCRI